MQTICDKNSVASIGNPEMRCLVELRIQELVEFDPDAAPSLLAKFIVMEAGDRLDELDAQLGFPILTNRWTGVRFGQVGFTPSWEVLEEHRTCYEMVFVLSDDGYGVELFIPKHPSMDSELLSMCAEFSLPAQPILPN